MNKKIVILAMSEKYGNFCVAGIDVNTGEWVRPYSYNKETFGAVPLEHMIYENGRQAKIFDVVKIQFDNSCENFVQPENYYYNEAVKWQKVDQLNLVEVVKLHSFDDREKIFFNHERRVTYQEIKLNKNRESLLMLYVTDLNVIVSNSPLDNRKRIRLSFNHEGANYSGFSISDINIKEEYLNKSEGSYPFAQKAAIVASLTDKYKDGKYYKMAAQFLSIKK